ncbi:hypothetical protein CO704_09930 [Cedecea neteri]|uniref:Uncharacterized protein n=1 Tax=Cedecea neteri TaxID=158822 RepID=A0A291DX43_9ENTR|nr:hypothetical protein CO704_09930 [Cedecea neteri]
MDIAIRREITALRAIGFNSCFLLLMTAVLQAHLLFIVMYRVCCAWMCIPGFGRSRASEMTVVTGMQATWRLLS